MLGFWHNQAWMDMITRSFGPYQTNPLNINPLRDAIDALIDFDRVRACTDVEIFISATNVWTGKVAIFGRQELTADHLMASACLPTVFQAVEIDGVPYWDGGYMGNPALYPLYYESMTDDILLVQINPLERRQTRVHRSDAPRRALPQAHRSPALGTVRRRRRIHEIRRSYLVGTWAEHVRQRDNRLTGADRRFKEQARAYAVGEPQVAHLLPPPAKEPTKKR